MPRRSRMRGPASTPQHYPNRESRQPERGRNSLRKAVRRLLTPLRSREDDIPGEAVVRRACVYRGRSIMCPPSRTHHRERLGPQGMLMFRKATPLSVSDGPTEQ